MLLVSTVPWPIAPVLISSRNQAALRGSISL
jgi:hypothetical protein